jgi:hypothetical protein
MNTYKIADLIVNLKNNGETLNAQGKPYLTDKRETADITIALTDEFLIAKQTENPHLTLDRCEYIWTGGQFYDRLIDFSGLMLHSSALAMDNKAYLFSAKSGTGKSTHTELWEKYFGKDKVMIINDDKPAIRFADNTFYVYGTPWSGKSDKNINRKVPLQSIVFIEQSQENWIKRIDSKQGVRLILQQTVVPKDIEKMDKLLVLLDRLLKTIPIYAMGCNISVDAVKLAYNTLKR